MQWNTNAFVGTILGVSFGVTEGVAVTLPVGVMVVLVSPSHLAYNVISLVTKFFSVN